jgi:hypothetical protein
MSSRTLLRSAALVYALFAIGHTMGAMFGNTHRGGQQAEVFAAMRNYTFHVQGVTRSYWDFYRGFGFMVSVLLALIAALCWVLADMSRTQPRDARRLLVVLLAAMAFTTWFSFVDFFAAPMVFSAIAMLIGISAAVALGREANRALVGGGSTR